MTGSSWIKRYWLELAIMRSKQHISCWMGEELMTLRCHARPMWLSKGQAMARLLQKLNSGSKGLYLRQTIKSSRREEKANGSLWEQVMEMMREERCCEQRPIFWHLTSLVFKEFRKTWGVWPFVWVKWTMVFQSKEHYRVTRGILLDLDTVLFQQLRKAGSWRRGFKE